MTSQHKPPAHLTEETIVDYKAHFDTFDPESKGKIPVTDVPTLMRKVGLMPSNMEVEEMIIEVDTNKNSALEGIDFQQFCAIAAKKYNEVYIEADMISCFKVFDLDNNGYISNTEMRRAMCGMGEKLTEDEMDAFLDNAPVDMDGNIIYEQFVKNMMRGINL